MRGKRSIITVISLVSVLAIVCGVGFTYAKYKRNETGVIEGKLHDFAVTFSFSYVDDDTGIRQTLQAEDLSGTHGLLRLSLTEYDTLQVNTVYTGCGRCMYRFRMIESWQHIADGGTERITPKALSTYVLDTSLYDNRSDDGYIYSGILSGANDNSVLTCQAITACMQGLDATDLLDEADVSTFVDIAFELDAVQWNRAKVMWRLSNEQWSRINN